jgi:formylglycine-generating enzyme required for sulfatase activity
VRFTGPLTATVVALSLVATAGLVSIIAPNGRNLDVIPQMVRARVNTEFGAPLFVQVYEVTIAEWNQCHDAGACSLSIKSRDASDGDYPATGFSKIDTDEYLSWLNSTSGLEFRLPTESEWYAMAASVLPETPDPIFTDPELTWASAYLFAPQTDRGLRSNGAYSTTDAGISDLDGNVWEWTQDCYDQRQKDDRCPAYVVAGEHLAVIPFLVRDPARGGCAVGLPPAHLGMRVVIEEEPPNFEAQISTLGTIKGKGA